LIKDTHFNINNTPIHNQFHNTCGRLSEKAYAQQAGHLKKTKNENNVQ